MKAPRTFDATPSREELSRDGASCRLCGLCAQRLGPGDFAGHHPWCLGDVVAGQSIDSGGPSCQICGQRISQRDYAAAWPYDSQCACPSPVSQSGIRWPCYACASLGHDRPGAGTGCAIDQRWEERHLAQQVIESPRPPHPPTEQPRRLAARGVRIV